MRNKAKFTKSWLARDLALFAACDKQVDKHITPNYCKYHPWGLINAIQIHICNWKHCHMLCPIHFIVSEKKGVWRQRQWNSLLAANAYEQVLRPPAAELVALALAEAGNPAGQHGSSTGPTSCECSG